MSDEQLQVDDQNNIDISSIEQVNKPIHFINYLKFKFKQSILSSSKEEIKKSFDENHFSDIYILNINEVFKHKGIISLNEIIEQLSVYTINNAKSISEDFINLAPFNDYSKYTEEKPDIERFLKQQAFQPQYWLWENVGISEENKSFIKLKFNNSSIDEGQSLQGFVFIDFNDCKVKHIFCVCNQ